MDLLNSDDETGEDKVLPVQNGRLEIKLKGNWGAVLKIKGKINMTTRKQADQAQKAIPVTAHKTTRKSTGTKTAAKNTSSKSTAAKSKTQGKTAGSAAARKNAGNTGLISDLDCYLFGAGTHYEIYKKLGAHPMTYKGKRASILVYGRHMPRQSIW